MAVLSLRAWILCPSAAAIVLAVACGGAEGDVLRAVGDAGAPALDGSGPLTDGSTEEASTDASGDGGVDAAPDACAGKDLSSDPAHCGACFHDCLGGPCNGGVCGPVLVANVPSPAGIAVDDDHVYFASTVADGGVYAARKDGTGKTLLVDGLSLPARLAQAGTRVYYTTLGSPGLLGSVEKDGSAHRTLSLTNASPTDIVVDGNAVYFIDLYAAAIRKTTVDGEPDAGKAPALVSGISYPNGLATFAGDLFWASRGTFTAPDGGPAGFNSQDGVIQALALDGGTTARNVATGRSDPLSVAADATGVYWVDGQGDRIAKLAAGASTPVDLATGVPRPWGIVLDETHAYVTCRGAGADGTGMLVRVRKDGSSPKAEVLVTDLAFPTTLAVDDRAVYFSNTHGGTVMKVAK